MEENKIKNRQSAFFRQLFFLAVIIAIGLVIFKQLLFFIGSFLGAVTIYIVLRRTQFNLVEKQNWKPWLAALFQVAMMSVVLIGIGTLAFNAITNEIENFDTQKTIESLHLLPEKISTALGVKNINENIIPKTNDYLAQFTSGILNSAYSFVINVALMVVILYFMLANGREMEKKTVDYLPFWGKSLEMIKHEVKNMIYSNAIGIPLVMLGQGGAAALLYWSLGLDDIFFWAFVTALAGLIPMIGSVIVSAPLGIWLIANGDTWQGMTLILAGIIVVANVDNIIRIILMKQVANTPPLVVIFGVILGIPLFGFWGIIFGPLLIAGFLLLIKIYYVEYGLIEPEKAKCEPGKHTHPGQKTVHKVIRRISGRTPAIKTGK